MTSSAYAAEWVLPIGAEPIRDGVVVVQGGRVVWVGAWRDLPPELADAGGIERRRGILTPGLINAHTHLQYTGFDAVGRGRYTSFEHWADAFEVVYLQQDDASWHPAAVAGARQAIASGTTMVTEIVTDDPARGAVAACGAGGIEYLEAIGQYESRWHGGGRDAYLAWLAEPAGIGVGISPHALYSLDGAVVRDLVAIAGAHGMRVHTHLGESSVEANLYRSGDARVLEVFGDLRDEFELVRRGGIGQSTGDYADALGLLGAHTHVAHAIYLDRDERDQLLRRDTQVALCPRSNAIIGLDEAPVAAYLNEGHEIAVGTDSLASSPSLDLLADVGELERIARGQGYTADDLCARLVRAATLGGAKAMGLDAAGYGILAAGGPADLAVFAVEVEADRVHEALVHRGEGSCVLTVHGGTVLHER